jgi:hypothetical protein
MESVQSELAGLKKLMAKLLIKDSVPQSSASAASQQTGLVNGANPVRAVDQHSGPIAHNLSQSSNSASNPSVSSDGIPLRPAGIINQQAINHQHNADQLDSNPISTMLEDHIRGKFSLPQSWPDSNGILRISHAAKSELYGNWLTRIKVNVQQYPIFRLILNRPATIAWATFKMNHPRVNEGQLAQYFITFQFHLWKYIYNGLEPTLGNQLDILMRSDPDRRYHLPSILNLPDIVEPDFHEDCYSLMELINIRFARKSETRALALMGTLMKLKYETSVMEQLITTYQLNQNCPESTDKLI